MTRELKLALIVGFSVVLVVTVLIADHLSPGSQSRLAMDLPVEPPRVVENPDEAIADAPKVERVAGASTGTGVTEPGSFTFNNGERAPTPIAGPTGTTTPREPGTTIVMGGGRGSQTGGIIEQLRESVPTEIAVPPGAVKIVERPMPAPRDDVPNAGLPDKSDTTKTTPLAPAGTKPQPACADDRAHTVVEGDSAYKIAQKYYGDAKLWPKLAAYNGDRIGQNGRLRSGITLRIPTKEVLLGGASIDTNTGRVTPAKDVVKPEVKAEVKSQPKTAKAAEGVTYTVKKGDTLREIARRELGSTKRVNEIVELNRKVIRDVNNLPAGAVIKLPAKTV